MNCRSASLMLLTGALLAWAPAASAVDAAEVLGSGRVVLVPPNLGVRATAEVEPGVEPVWREILAHFAAQKQPATALERNERRGALERSDGRGARAAGARRVQGVRAVRAPDRGSGRLLGDRVPLARDARGACSG